MTTKFQVFKMKRDVLWLVTLRWLTNDNAQKEPTHIKENIYKNKIHAANKKEYVNKNTFAKQVHFQIKIQFKI